MSVGSYQKLMIQMAVPLPGVKKPQQSKESLSSCGFSVRSTRVMYFNDFLFPVMLYTISLSFYAAMARSRGNANVFNMSVEEASLWSHNSNIPLAYRDKATPQAMQPHSVPAATQV